MNLRPNNITPDDTTQEYIPIMFAGSVEPMRRADHKAKKHPRPAGVDRTRRVRCVSKRECGE